MRKWPGEKKRKHNRAQTPGKQNRKHAKEKARTRVGRTARGGKKKHETDRAGSKRGTLVGPINEKGLPGGNSKQKKKPLGYLKERKQISPQFRAGGKRASQSKKRGREGAGKPKDEKSTGKKGRGHHLKTVTGEERLTRSVNPKDQETGGNEHGGSRGGMALR